MLPKERVIAALEFRRPDRIPLGETGIDYTITEQALGRSSLYRGKWKEYTALWEGRRDAYVESCKRDIVGLARRFNHDVVPCFLVPSRHKPPDVPELLDTYTYRTRDGRVYVYSPQSEGLPFLVDAPPVTLDDIQEIPLDLDESELELVRHVVKEMGDTHFILGRPGVGVFPLTRYTFEFLLRGMAEQPELIQRIIEVETKRCMAISTVLLDAGCDAVLPDSDVAGNSGPFMSPRMFRQFIFPWLKAECDAAHARGKYLIKHTDGNMWLLLDMLIEAGVDGWHGIQPRIGMTLPALQERYGGRLCFWGGVDVETLMAGTTAEVAEQVRVAFASAPRSGGLVLTCGNAVVVGVRYDNYLAMNRTAQQLNGTDDEEPCGPHR